MIELSQYFEYGNKARSGIISTSTFNAIIAGERTATTRFPMWYKNNPDQLNTIKLLLPDQIICFRNTRNNIANTSKILVRVLSSDISKRQIDLYEKFNYPELADLKGATYAISKRKLESDPLFLQRWSRLEGWSEQAGLDFFSKEPTGIGYQFCFKFLEVIK